MILGLGVSHQPINKALGIDMPSPTRALRQYATEVASWLRGEGPATHLPQQPATYPVPIYLGALTSPTVELAGEVADGLMPFFMIRRKDRSEQGLDIARPGQVAGRAKLEITLGLPTFVGSDMAALREAARANLGLYATLPFFQHLLRVSGFSTEAEKAEQGAAAEALSDRFLDAVCLIGSVEVCRERLSAFRAAGLDLPILLSPIGIDGARAVIDAFRQ